MGAGRNNNGGVRNSQDGLEVRIGGERRRRGALAASLPLQVIDPEVHNLVAGGPECGGASWTGSRSTWNKSTSEVWRNFRRALKQRNAALKVEPRKRPSGAGTRVPVAGEPARHIAPPGSGRWRYSLLQHGRALLGAELRLFTGRAGRKTEPRGSAGGWPGAGAAAGGHAGGPASGRY